MVRGQSIFDGIHPDDHSTGVEQLEGAVRGGPGLYGPLRFRYLHADAAMFRAKNSGRCIALAT